MTNSPVRSRARTGVRRLALAAVVAAAVVGSATTAWATTTGPTPVKADPTVDESAPAAHGRWFGWSQNSAGHENRFTFYVQRGDEQPVRVNPPATQGLGGDIVAGRVVYAERDQGYPRGSVHIRVFDPATGTRTSLPARVNELRHRGPYPHQGDPRVPLLRLVQGDVSASGPWVLYTGLERRVDGVGDDLRTVMLYNRRTHVVRRLLTTYPDQKDVVAGQVDGDWVTYTWATTYPSGRFLSKVVRYDVTTREREATSAMAYQGRDAAPAVSADGTVYYLKGEKGCGDGCQVLYRWPVGGSPVAVSTTPAPSPRLAATDLRVQDLPDGRHAVYVATSDAGMDSNIYEYVDDPSTPTATTTTTTQH